MNKKQVLVIDDFPDMRHLLRRELESAGYSVETAATGAEAIEIVRDGFEGVIVMDLQLPDCRDLELFGKVREIDDENQIVIITAHGNVDIALRATRAGAFDFITKSENTVKRVMVACNNAHRQMEMKQRLLVLSDGIEKRFERQSIVAGSARMRQVLKMLEHVVDSKVTVLVHGESGTGKEVVARAIHHNGPRRAEPFVAINCAGIPDTLLESELFGYEKGAFTGAVGRKQGRFELADRGTIFLDEIGEMNPALQSKILRVIQERQFERLGGTKSISVDVRIISATNRDLIEEVERGRFREDLFYRLGVFQITLPPLREREGDVELLTDHFIQHYAEEENKPIRFITKEARDIIRNHRFPGNVRQLQNVISHAVVVCTSDTIDAQDLPTTFIDESNKATMTERAGPAPYDRMLALLRRPDQIPPLQELEKAVIRRALEVCQGNVVEVAKRLGVSRATIYRRKRQLDEALPDSTRLEAVTRTEPPIESDSESRAAGGI